MQIAQTACPLDCYDACRVDFSSGKLKGEKDTSTQGFLCRHLNHYEEYATIESPRYKGEEISLEEALKKLVEIFNATLKSEILHYRGSGNFALMQEVSDYLFASLGATLTDGSLCDGAGAAGIVAGRGSNKNMPMSEIEKAEVVILWGRNPHTTSSHLLPALEKKELIVIDPIRTKIAKKADIHIQIRPHGDLYLAMLIVRFLHINGVCDEEYLQKYASGFEEYYELTQSVRIKAILEEIDVTLGQIGEIIEMLEGKRVAIVCGVGVQKYRDGADVMRSIDAIAVALGLFGKEGCGVAYLGESQEGIHSPFKRKAKRLSKVDTEFDAFKTLFVQGANPLSQMPNTQRVKNALERVETLIYFGLYENETSEVADLVIPAKSFLAKNDIRSSYAENKIIMMPKQQESEYGISEYDLAEYLSREFGVELKSEAEYIEEFRSFSRKNEAGLLELKERVDIPYREGFDGDDGEFHFLEEYETLKSDSGLHLLTPKSSKSLNSQFERERHIYLHSSLGFDEAEEVRVSSCIGSVVLEVRHNDDLRQDCALIYSGTRGVNYLTSSKHSFEGKSAVFQEERVQVVGI